MKTRMPRRPRSLQLETLEGKALLAAAATRLVLPPALIGPVQVRAAVASTPAPTAGRVSAQQVADNGTTQITHERFKVRGGQTSYDLNLKEGGYKFDQSYDLTVRRVRGQVQTGTLTAAEAAGLFYARFDELSTNAIANGGNTNHGGLTGGDFEDIEVRKQNYSIRNGKTTYNLTFRSGGYEFQQSYTLKVRRDGNSPITGTLSAADAVGLFVQRFDTLATQYVSTHGAGNI